MSLFYKTQTNQNNRNSFENNQSIVRPYGAQPIQQPVPSSFYSKKVEPTNVIKQQKHIPSHVDPIFPQKNKQATAEDGLKKSILLANNQDQKQSWLTKCCSCANLQSYKKFFHVTNSDVAKRAQMNLLFWSSNFFGPQEQYDFYGPFWIYTTVVFCLSAVPNILLYQGSQSFQYNFSIVGLAFGFIYLQGFLFPAILTFILKLLGVDCTYIQNICLYGYSMCIVVICLLLCSINVCLLHIILLGYAFTTKALFILNNIFKSYNIPIPKKALITGLVIGEAVLQFFVIKVFFINCVPESEPASSKSTSQSHHMTFVDDFHYFARQFTK